MSELAPPPTVLKPLSIIEGYLDIFSSTLELPANLVEAIRYSFLSSGKRLRPLLAWHCASAVGGDPRASLPAAGAVELIHAFSLVHDDLPGIDNDDLRRGKPTLHKQTTEAMAILAGDAMLTLAFQILVERIPETLLARDLVRELAVGTSAMIAGQVYDTLGGFAESVGPRDRLTTIHHNKTGALIRASCRMGALCGLHHPAVKPDSLPAHSLAANAMQSSLLAAISAYADAVGLMFQIVDDLLDVTQTTDHLGKKSGKDIDAGKLTYPAVHGIDASKQHVRELESAALSAIAPLGESAEPLRELASYMAIRTR
ncbi:MAG: polyprenyl synthetase family protein [Pyrinomonadaceae bacterium]|nr:polyprenyl synthetase family protein [Phycisphaerales bacterium]